MHTLDRYQVYLIKSHNVISTNNRKHSIDWYDSICMNSNQMLSLLKNSNRTERVVSSVSLFILRFKSL